MIDVVIVGPGRLGKTAAAALERAGHRVRLVGRDIPVPSGPLIWLTVPDRAVAEVARHVPTGGVVLHAAGALDHEVLRPHAPAGSLHPLMTFPGLEVAPPPVGPVPAAVAGDPLAREAATGLARALAWTPFEVPGDRRLYHAAAVMAGNFATALLAEAAQVLAAAGVPGHLAPALLAPLALRSIANAAEKGPRPALTGPVARGDTEVLQAHQDALASLPERIRLTYTALLASAAALAASRPDVER